MLPNHAPLVVAEQFGTLEALYPGRIDLGLGRAPGGDFQTMRALRRDLQQSGDDFPALLAELQTYLGPESPGQVVKAIPGQGSNVPITLLGSSGFSAQLAAMQGLAFAFAAHFAPELLYAAAQLYREEFRPSEVLRYLGVSFTAVMPGSGRVGGFRIPPMHGKLGISTSNHEPVDGICGHASTDFTPEFLQRCHALSSVHQWLVTLTSRSRLVADLVSESSVRRLVPSSRYREGGRHDPSSKPRG